ncbi:MAG: tetratricopeptide repeat protein, partial [Brachymonas sp.]|nr:tetratricopeptide repeat protein [Brachymonas sp.]
EWVAGNAADESYRAIAKLRLASILFESKGYDAALKQVEGLPKEFEALAQDRRGDIFLAQGKRDEAKKAFEAAYKSLDERSEYRRLVEVKLNSLGVEVEAKKADAGAQTAPAQPATAEPAAPAASGSAK